MAFFTTRRGLRGGIFFRRRELLFSVKGSHVQQETLIDSRPSHSLHYFSLLNLCLALSYWLSLLGIFPSSIWCINLDSSHDWTIC
jgi:hypothetical protein